MDNVNWRNNLIVANTTAPFACWSLSSSRFMMSNISLLSEGTYLATNSRTVHCAHSLNSLILQARQSILINLKNRLAWRERWTVTIITYWDFLCRLKIEIWKRAYKKTNRNRKLGKTVSAHIRNNINSINNLDLQQSTISTKLGAWLFCLFIQQSRF